MKTYACPGCGDRYQVTADYETDCQNCGREMHALDGIVRGGGVMAIWRDGREAWSGTGLEAVELLAKLLPGENADYGYRGWMINECDSDGMTLRIKSPGGYVRRVEFAGNEQAAEADRIVRELANSTARGFSVFEVYKTTRDKAVEYSTKYHKT